MNPIDLKRKFEKEHKKLRVISITDFGNYFIVIPVLRESEDEVLLRPPSAINKKTGKELAFSPISFDMTGYEKAYKNSTIYFDK